MSGGGVEGGFSKGAAFAGCPWSPLSMGGGSGKRGSSPFV